MKNKSIWEEYLKEAKQTLDKSIDVDIAIIGAGITGLSIAYFLTCTNKRIVILEKNTIGSGVTSRTTGKITFLQDGILSKIKRIYNENKAMLYYKATKDAIANLTNIIKKEDIACDLQEVESYYFTNDKNKIKTIKEEKEILLKCNEQVEEISKLPDGLNIKYGIKSPKTYVFNPIKYLNSLKKIIENQIPVYENTKVTSINKQDNIYHLEANKKLIKAKIVIICTHYPYFLLPFLMPLKCSLEKSFIAAYENISDINFSAISPDKPNLSIRYVEGNKRHKLLLTNSTNLAYVNNIDNNFNILKHEKPDYIWSNTDIITKDYLPYIGEIDENMYLATGYNTWGMTNSIIAGQVIRDIITKSENKYITLFTPYRKNNSKTFLKYPLYIVNNTYSYLYSKIDKNKSWYKENVLITKINGVSVGIYYDEKGEKHIVKNKCPHLGCSLIFNNEEKTWDCPCHASRFDIKGNVILGPSNYNIKFDDEKTS